MPETQQIEVNPTLAVFEKYTPMAAKLETSQLLKYRGDIDLARHNVAVGLAAVQAEKVLLDKQVVGTDWRLLGELPELVAAVSYANSLMVEPPKDRELQKKAAEGRELRRALMAFMEAAVAAKLVPEGDAKKVREGLGQMDAANDLVLLAALFARYPKAAASTPVTKEQLKRAHELGTELTNAYKPAKAAKAEKPLPGGMNPAEARNRLWTLLKLRYDEVRRLGAWRWLDEAPTRVPALLHQSGRKKKVAAKE